MRIPLKTNPGQQDLASLAEQKLAGLKKENRKKVVVVGGGPAGMMAAWHLAESCEVKLFEKSAQLGRKFLLAGKGGLNITHEADREELKKAYSPFGIMDKVLDQFDQAAFREWLMQLGIPTYEGSSGKVFPEKGMDGSNVLKKITDSLLARGVTIYVNHRLTAFTNDKLTGFSGDTTTRYTGNTTTGYTEDKLTNITGDMRFTFDIHDIGLEEHRIVHYDADFAVLALGGASWPLTGSDGKWVEMFHGHGISTLPFQPSNCGVNIDWPLSVREFHSGKPLKNLVISVETTNVNFISTDSEHTHDNSTDPADKLSTSAEINSTSAEINSTSAETNNISAETKTPTLDNKTTSKGEALITEYGLEGTAIYPLIPMIMQLLTEGAKPLLVIDFKPLNTVEQLVKRISGKKSSLYGKELALDSAQMAVIKAFTGKEEFLNPTRFCAAVKQLQVPISSLRPVEEAISVVGGVDLADLGEDFSLRKFPRIFSIGEMVNWDAPTGGFLLQGCFSMGAYVAGIINKKPHH